MNFRRVYASVVVSLKHFFRETSSVFFVLLFPILLILLFGFIFQGQGDVTYDLHVQNLDGGPMSLELIDELNATVNGSRLFEVHPVPEDANASEYFKDNNLNTLIIIPDGFTEHIQLMQNLSAAGQQTYPVPVTVMFDDTNSAAGSKFSIFNSKLETFNKEKTNATTLVFSLPQVTTSQDLEFIDYFVPGIIAMSVMTSSIFGTVGMITELKQKGIFRKLATTPLTKAEWILSNVLYQFVMALMSTAIIITVGFIVFGLRPDINIFMFMFIVLDVFAFGGIGMLITRFVKEAESAQAAANAIMFPMMFLSGTFFPFEMMPDFLQKIADFLPLYYVNEGLRAAMIENDMGAIIFNASVVLAFAAIVFVMGIYLTTWKDD